MVEFDFKRREIVIKVPFYPTNNTLSDFKLILEFFTSIQGKNPNIGVGMAMYKQLVADMENEKL